MCHAMLLSKSVSFMGDAVHTFVIENVRFSWSDGRCTASALESVAAAVFFRSLVLDAASGESVPVKVIGGKFHHQSVFVPRSVEAVSSDCLSLSAICFEHSSELRQVGGRALSGSAVKCITIPRNVLVIGFGCLCGCASLSSVTFDGDSQLQRIKARAFAGSACESIIVPGSVLTIGSECFHFCQSLSSVLFQRDCQLRRIESKAFFRCAIKSIVIPRSVLTIGRGRFALCELLVSVSFEIDSQLREIESGAFSKSALKEIVVPTKVEVIGSSCFLGCRFFSSISFEKDSQLKRIEAKGFRRSLVTSITIPRRVSFIDGSAISCITKIAIEEDNQSFVVEGHFILTSDRRKLIRYFGSASSIVIPRNIEVLCTSCFNHCKCISSVSFTVGSRVKRIASDAFAHSSLQGITIPRSVEIIEDGCFYKCSSICSVSFECDCCLQQIESFTFCESSLTSITIPRNVKRLMPQSFSGCRTLSTISVESGSQLLRIESAVFPRSSLKSIRIPRSVRFIHGAALFMVTGVSISVEVGNEFFQIDNEFVVTSDRTRFIRYFGSDSSVAVPRNVRAIAADCFSFNNFLSSISFEADSQLKRIESYAFANSGLTSIVVPRSVEVLEAKCFALCHSLSSVLFESDSQLSRIESESFCDSLVTSITIPRNVTFVHGSAFIGVNELSIEGGSFVIHDKSVLSCDRTELVLHFGSDSSMSIPRTVRTLGPYCCYRCQSVSSVIIEANSQLARIGAKAFHSSSLASIVIPRTVLEIGPKCFFSCRLLVAISFESGSQLERIESRAFSLSELKSIAVPQTVTFIHGSAFSGLDDVSVSFERGNKSFVINQGFILSRDRRTLIAYFGSDELAVIPQYIEVLGPSCFSSNVSLATVSFEDRCRVRRIESLAFRFCLLSSITVPRSVTFVDGSAFVDLFGFSVSVESGNQSFAVRKHFLVSYDRTRMIRYFGSKTWAEIPQSIEILCESSFARCRHLSSIAFTNHSQLKRIEPRAFAETCLRWIRLPTQKLFIAGDAIPTDCDIEIPDSGSCPEFAEWNLLRRADSTVSFQASADEGGTS
jgi:hypothetical protein